MVSYQKDKGRPHCTYSPARYIWQTVEQYRESHVIRPFIMNYGVGVCGKLQILHLAILIGQEE